jgi:hypothetical protein
MSTCGPADVFGTPSKLGHACPFSPVPPEREWARRRSWHGGQGASECSNRKFAEAAVPSLHLKVLARTRVRVTEDASLNVGFTYSG